MRILQLDPPLPFETPRGRALAHIVIDYGPELDVFWGCFGDADGQCWWWPNHKVRMQANVSMGRDSVTPPPAEPA